MVSLQWNLSYDAFKTTTTEQTNKQNATLSIIYIGSLLVGP